MSRDQSDPASFPESRLQLVRRGLQTYPKTACNNGAINWKHPDIFMGADDIPALFGYLKKNGYTVDTDLTKMMFKGPVTIGGPSQSRFSGDRKMICMVTKN
jgi:hypothetical protein